MEWKDSRVRVGEEWWFWLWSQRFWRVGGEVDLVSRFRGNGRAWCAERSTVG